MKRTKAQQSTTTKGRVVERLVAELHKGPGVIKIEQNKRIPVPRSDMKRTREIDVLLTLDIPGGYVQLLPIECKNEKQPIDVVEVGEFIEKLQDLDMPTNFSVFVSASGFKPGAIDRARSAGVRLLTLTGLSTNGFDSILWDIYENTVFLLLRVFRIQAATPSVSELNPIPVFVDEQHGYIGNPMDILWYLWKNKYIHPVLGSFKKMLPVPKGVIPLDSATQLPIQEPLSLTLEFKIVGQIITRHGKGIQHLLIDPKTNDLDSGRIIFNYDTEDELKVVTMHSELELRSLMHEPSGAINITLERVLLPRIQWGRIFWPLSQRVASSLQEHSRNNHIGSKNSPTIVSDLDIEGEDLSVAWEPIMEDHLANWDLIAKFWISTNRNADD